MKRTAIGILLVLALSAPGAGFSASVTMSPAGGGVYFLAGQGLLNVSGLDVTITYDASSLRSPRVSSQGLLSGALLMANTSNAGSIRIAAVRQNAIQGSGMLATISFDASNPGSAGQGISGLQVNAISPNGVKSPVTAVITGQKTSTSSGEETETADQPAQQITAAAAGTSYIPVASEVRAAEESDRDETVRRDDRSGPAPAAVQEQAAGVDSAGEGKELQSEAAKEETGGRHRLLTQKSVLDRFRNFSGPWTVESAVRLFRQDPLLGCRQDPDVALSDGKSTVTLTVVVSAGSGTQPAFTMTGGKVLSSVRDRENTNTWKVKVRPDRDALHAVFSVDDGSMVREIPLAVAPEARIDLDGSGTVTEKDFALYGLRRRAKAGKETNFLADYIFVANYLAASARPSARNGRPALVEARTARRQHQ